MKAQVIARAYVENGDTVPLLTLREVRVSDIMSEAARERKKEFNKLVYHVRKVMPIAKQFTAKMEEIENATEGMSKREKRKYLKEQEEVLKSQYEDQLKDLTFTQGKVLIKLLDRETGKSSYELIKLYKSSFSALFWQSTARIFGMNLKNSYDPEQEEAIEMVLQSMGY